MKKKVKIRTLHQYKSKATKLTLSIIGSTISTETSRIHTFR